MRPSFAFADKQGTIPACGHTVKLLSTPVIIRTAIHNEKAEIIETATGGIIAVELTWPRRGSFTGHHINPSVMADRKATQPPGCAHFPKVYKAHRNRVKPEKVTVRS